MNSSVPHESSSPLSLAPADADPGHGHFNPSGLLLEANSSSHSRVLVFGVSLLCSLFHLHVSIPITHRIVIISILIMGRDLIHLTITEENRSRLGPEFRRPRLNPFIF